MWSKSAPSFAQGIVSNEVRCPHSVAKAIATHCCQDAPRIQYKAMHWARCLGRIHDKSQVRAEIDNIYSDYVFVPCTHHYGRMR
jgi:hypothetical protein